DGVANLAEIKPCGLRVIARVNSAATFVVGHVEDVKYVLGTRCLEDGTHPRAFTRSVRRKIEHDRCAKFEDAGRKRPDDCPDAPRARAILRKCRNGMEERKKPLFLNE